MLDDFLPAYDVNGVHSTVVAAPPATVMEAVRRVTPREVPVLVGLMAIRSLPALLRRRPPSPRGTILEGFTRGGFVVMRDDFVAPARASPRPRAQPDELVAGAIGRFWQPAGGLRPFAPAEFRDFAEPGYAKGVVSFTVEPAPGRTLLTTETRVAGTDDRSRRMFRRYWRLIRPGSGAIRIAWLRAIRKRAERAEPGGDGQPGGAAQPAPAQAGSSPRSARP